VDITEHPPFVSHDSILSTHGRRTKRAYVLLHGLTATPLQFAAFGRLLYDRGANVYIPRLPRHGHADRLTTVLRDLTAAELRAFATEALAAARELGREVVVAGFSVGGLMSAWIGQHYAVARSVSVAPFLGFAFLPQALTGRAARLALRAPNQFWWWDPLLRERFGPEHGYPRFATHAVAEAATLAHELLADARSRVPATADLHVVLNARETTVSNAAARRLAQAWTRSGRTVGLHRIPGLPLSHDIIEPGRFPALARRVYPRLLELVAS